MALIEAQQGIDSFSVDLNFYVRHFYDDEFIDNAYVEFAGQTYEDRYVVNGYNGSTDLLVAFLGHGFGFNSSGYVNRGTVTAMGEATYSGEDIWYMQDISVSASRLNDVAQTFGNADDRALMAEILRGNDTIRLSQFDDRFEGWGGDDRMFGGYGNDTLLGGAGNDILQGGFGNDVLNGGTGRDQLIGGAGNDIYLVTAGDVTTESQGGGIDRVQSAIGWTLGSHIEHLTLTGAGNVNATGNNLDNTITGNAGNNVLNGAAGNDRLVGNAGNDRLVGGLGNDMLGGGAGADTLVGGLGKDIMYGGEGADRDVFVFNSVMDSRFGSQRDQVNHFQAGLDEIDLSGIDANTHAARNQQFMFAGTEAEDHSVWYVRQAGGVIVRGDVNGDHQADFEIWINGVTQLNEGDFIL
ncbi:calcium-binding protein [Paracoccus sp. (in: a-proteobacteria)]|uniref:calcium-binding protein n=1 Tax=Paracoccus sp. TaxID=267 RepID=UPI00396C8DEF